MKMRKLPIVVLIIFVFLTAMANAETNISAHHSGERLQISWKAQGECLLTIYRNGWPMSVGYVDGASGGIIVSVPVDGKYSVRLKTGMDCVTADAVADAPMVEPTVVPTAVPTEEPTSAPTSVPTASPTKVPVNNGSQTQQASGMAAEVVRVVNEERARYGLMPLSVSAELTNAACIRAEEISKLFSHTRPNGSSWSTVSSAAKGENIARGQASAERVMAAWMTSDGHRENILRESFGSIGVCALNIGGVMHWVQLFGK